jgi:hypothetical protein
MRRRDFMTGLGIAAALPAVSRAQQAIPTIGFPPPARPMKPPSTPMRFAAVWKRRDMSRAAVSPLSTAGPGASMASCQRLRPSC